MTFSAIITWAELDTGNNSQAPWIMARIKICRIVMGYALRQRQVSMWNADGRGPARGQSCLEGDSSATTVIGTGDDMLCQ